MGYQILIDELTIDPLGRGYSTMTDEEAADDMNLFIRDGDTDIATLFYYLMFNTFKLDSGLDTQDRALWARIKDVASIPPWNTGTEPDPWGGGTSITEIRGIKCRQLLDFFTLSLQGALPLSLTDTNFGVYLAGAEAAGCMSDVQKDAIVALSENKQSRGMEIGWGHVKVGHIQVARSA